MILSGLFITFCLMKKLLATAKRFFELEKSHFQPIAQSGHGTGCFMRLIGTIVASFDYEDSTTNVIFQF